MVVRNPNWPLIDEAVSFLTGPQNPQPATTWVSMIERSRKQFTTSRGRQYEDDQNETGTANTTWQNKDGALDPNNTGSPFYPLVKPYRAYRRRAQYPATINILTAAQATAGVTGYDEHGLAVAALAAGVLPTWVAGNYAPSTDGSGHYTNTVPSSPTANTQLILMQGWSVTPGQTYTASITVQSTASITLQVAWLQHFANGTTTVSTGTSSSHAVTTSQTITGSYAAASNVVGVDLCLLLVSGSSACTVKSSQYMVQPGNSASAYVTPSPWYSIFDNAYVERFPQSWEASGQYGLSAVTCVDAWGWLSQQIIRNPVYQEILATEPQALQFFYPLDEPAGSAQFLDATGRQAPIFFAARGPGVGGFTAEAGADLIPGPGAVNGTAGPVAQITQTGSGVGSLVLPLTDTANTWPSQTGTGWTRLWICNPSATLAGGKPAMWILLQAVPLSSGAVLGPTFIGVTVNASGYALIQISRSGSLLMNIACAPVVVNDGAFHVFGVTLSADQRTATLRVDGVSLATYTDASSMMFAPLGGVDLLGTADPSNAIQYSCLAQWNVELSEDEFDQIAQTFLQGGGTPNGNQVLPFSSADRYADILRWLRFAGQVNIDNYTTGQTTNYGPPSELFATMAEDGTDGVSALQTVIDTENGSGYMSAGGFATLKARRARYNQTTPKVIFGEDPTHTGAEIPYTGDVQFGLDPSRVATDAQFTQTSTNNVTRWIDPSVVADTAPDISIQRDINSLDAYEITDAAKFTVNRLKDAHTRLETIHINVGSNPTAPVWTAMLGLEEGDFVQVKRRPPSPAAAMTLLGFVEHIDWTMDDNADAGVDLQISPYVGQQVFEVGATKLTLKSATSAGASSFVVNPMIDAATNPIQANISSAGNDFEWIIDRGLATEELITIVKPTPGSTGYTSATLTIGACLRTDTGSDGGSPFFAHGVGAVIEDIGGLGLAYFFELGLTNTPSIGSIRAILASPTVNTYAVLDSTAILGY